MVEIVVRIKLMRSRLYGGDRGEICNFLFLFITYTKIFRVRLGFVYFAETENFLPKVR